MNNVEEVVEAWEAEEIAEKEWEQQVLGKFDTVNSMKQEKRVAILGGSGLLESKTFSHLRKVPVGDIMISQSDELLFISRHSCSKDGKYLPPHQVQQKDIWKVLKQLDPEIVVGICSVGSLKPKPIPIGSILCPTDWFQANFTPLNYFEDAQAHVRPTLDLKLREIVVNGLKADSALKSHVVDSTDDELVYVQTRGPRFETKAEIRFLKQVADVVGMTAGDEATLACELGIPYIMVCIVDNLAHGLSIASDNTINDINAFRKAQRENLALVERTVEIVIKTLATRGKANKILPLLKQIPSFPIKTLIRARYVATVDPADTLILNGLVAISNEGVIVGVHSEANGDYPQYSPSQIYEYPDSLIMPGLVNAHTHAAMVLMRGFGDDMKLTDWLVTKIWPAEAKCVSPTYVREGTILAVEEMITSGTTTFSDMYFFSNEIEEVAKEMGIRTVIPLILLEFPTAMAQNAEDYLRIAKERLERTRKEKTNDLISFSISPHAPYSVSEQHLMDAKKLAEEYNCIFHTHVHECEEEIIASVNLDRHSGFCHQCSVPCRPLKNLETIGVIDSSSVFAHMTQLEDEEIKMLAEKKCNVVHCPSSNLKLASGFCPVARLLSAGVNVCLGTDGAASNNSLDMIAEIKLAALLAKGVSKSPTAVNARQAVRIATINGAKALQLDHICGSIEVNKKADLICVDLDNTTYCRPVFDPISAFVYSASRNCVRSVWINGEAKLLDGVRIHNHSYSEENELRACSDKWMEKMIQLDAELASQ